MRKRPITSRFIIVILIFSLTACSFLLRGNSTDHSTDDLLGEWEYLSSENGNAYLANDIEFLIDGTLRIT